MRSKKSTWLCMGMALVLGMTGCGKGTGSSTGTQAAQTEGTKTEDNVQKETTGKFTYWLEMNPTAATAIQNLGETEYYKKLQEVTNTEIEFLHPPAGQMQEQFKLLIASRKDLPDVIAVDWLTLYPGGPEKAVNDGIIIDLNDYMDLMPNYKAFLESDPDLMKQAVTDEGILYGFHGVNMDSERPCDCGLFIRKDWLEELGLETPETIDEWENVLTKFKEEKGAEAPFSVTSTNFFKYNMFNAAYNVTNDFYLDENGNVQYGPIQPEYKAYLETMNRWYEKGLIDPDFASIDNKTLNANMINGKSGAGFGFIGSGMGTWTNAATEEGYKLVACTNPVLQKGEEGNILGRYKNKVLITAAVTTAAEDIESICRQFDYLYTEEGSLLKNFGVEGMTYETKDGKPVYTDLILNNPDGLAISEAMAKYVQCSYPGAGQANLPEYQEQYYQLEEQKEAVDIFNRYSENAAKYVIPPVTATSDESKELGNILSQVDIYRDEKVVAFITGAESLDNFDSFVDEMKKMGIDRAIEIKTASVERYNAR